MTRRLFFRKILTTPHFFEVLAKHLDAIFPNGWIYNAEEINDICCGVDSTVGWSKALKETCAEFNMNDVYEYYDSLTWEESDIVDDCVGVLLCAIVYDENGQRTNERGTRYD